MTNINEFGMSKGNNCGIAMASTWTPFPITPKRLRRILDKENASCMAEFGNATGIPDVSKQVDKKNGLHTRFNHPHPLSIWHISGCRVNVAKLWPPPR
nr:hypothetical protein [Thiobacillus sp.]